MGNSLTSKNLYLDGVQAFLDGDSKQFARILKNPHLGATERILLQCRSKFKQREWSETISVLLNLTDSSDSILAGEKYLLIAQAQSFCGKWLDSRESNLKAVEHFKRANVRGKLFLSYYNLSVDCGRLNDQTASSKYLKIAGKHAEKEPHKVLVLRAQACELGRQLRFRESAETIDRALEKIEFLNPQDAQTLSIVAADVYFKDNSWELARSILRKLLRSKRTQHNPRIVFNYRLIDRIIRNDFSSLRPWDQTAQLSEEYDLKWKLLLHIQSGEQELAKKIWRKLIQLFPRVYGQNFSFDHEADRRSPFGVYLKQIINSRPWSPQSQNNCLSPISGFSKKLVDVLSQSELPARKESLIENVWGQPYAPIFDSRFYKLIERLKKKGYAIQNLNQCYRLER